jgi:hypothetical protein
MAFSLPPFRSPPGPSARAAEDFRKYRQEPAETVVHPPQESEVTRRAAVTSQVERSDHGGHLFEATVRPTVEVVMTTYAKLGRRQMDPEWGLPLLAS